MTAAVKFRGEPGLKNVDRFYQKNITGREYTSEAVRTYQKRAAQNARCTRRMGRLARYDRETNALLALWKEALHCNCET